MGRKKVLDPIKNIKEVLTFEGEFSWLFNDKFFIETENKGNYVWSDPGYGGDGTVRPFTGTYDEYIKMAGIEYGRSKGTHIIWKYVTDEEYRIREFHSLISGRRK